MDIQKIQMPKEKAKEEWKKYNELIKKRQEKYLEDMKKCMFELSKGRELIDIYKVMEKVGVNKDYQPRIAVSRADWKNVFFVKKDSGRGFFASRNTNWPSKLDGYIDLQPQTFMDWPRRNNDAGKPITESWGIANEVCETKVPIIPAQLMPEGKLEGYYILWEVEKWENLPETKDPLLLKRITENLFVILGAWDLTDLEQSIISGRWKI